ncbi:hypothetical protein LCGC14_2676470 [marine sediment metagenome]|uniref:Uncharacterized protein n=1 Tax=marine sediment metagenome TaxID=412755 RepID=A0A0F8ZMM1_9ZZZZ
MGPGSGKTKLPPVAPPVPIPQDIDVQALQAGEAERRRLKARRGRRSTILTEGSLGVNEKKSLLGE